MNPQIQIQITSAVCSSIAIASTVQRISIRLRGAKLWFDDAWAIFSTLALIAQVVAVFTKVPSPRAVGPARYYIMASGFYMIIWSARLSILCSLIRLEPCPSWRRIWKGVGTLFFLTWMGLLLQLFWECEAESMEGWKQLQPPQCKLGKEVAILQLVTDIFADCILLWIPIRLFSAIMNKNMRTRLILIFSTCITTTIVSLVHASFILASGGPRELIAGISEDCISLLVCNLPLCIAQIFRQGKWFEDEDPITTSMWPSWIRQTLITNPGMAGTAHTHLDTTAGGRTSIQVTLPPQSDHLVLEDSCAGSHSKKIFTDHTDIEIDMAGQISEQLPPQLGAYDFDHLEIPEPVYKVV